MNLRRYGAWGVLLGAAFVGCEGGGSENDVQEAREDVQEARKEAVEADQNLREKQAELRQAEQLPPSQGGPALNPPPGGDTGPALEGNTVNPASTPEQPDPPVSPEAREANAAGGAGASDGADPTGP